MYWLFCLSGALYYFRHPTTCVHVADEYTSGHGLYVVCSWLVLLVLLYLVCLAAAVCTCLSGSTTSTAREVEHTACMWRVTPQAFSWL